MDKIETLIPDTSVIIEKVLTRKIRSKEIFADNIIIHEAVIAELEHQANENRQTGIIGLDEIKELKGLSEELDFKLSFAGQRPRLSEIRFASLGEIDAMIRELAYIEGATLITADKVQAKVAESKGINVLFIEFGAKPRKMTIEKFFDKETMSIHLRENMEPMAKKGKPGEWKLVKLSNKKLSRDNIKEMAKDIAEAGNSWPDGFIELDRKGSTIYQIGDYRIVVTRPPFSDAWEITAVKPLVKLKLSDYNISEKLSERINTQAEGILIAGAPGNGKTTFAQALAEHFSEQNRIVKTVEAPRDLQLSEKITQYAISHGSPEEIHDILLLTRPDYTIFDEMRNTSDFALFADLRLSGVGMIGVVHATNPIDAIQRFLGRIEMGVIPQIIDTVVFIKNGEVAKVFSVEMTVKVPAGMTEEDLSRPIVTVTDFETGKIEFEIYSYGEETIVVPVKEESSEEKQLAAQKIQAEIMKYVTNCHVKVVSKGKCLIYVPKDEIKNIIGKGGATIDKIQKKLGIHIDVDELANSDERKPISFSRNITSKYLEIFLEKRYANKDVDIMINGENFATVNVGKNGVIRIKRKNNLGKTLINAFNYNEKVEIFG